MAKILILEDELDVRRLLRSIIETAGHEVIEAGTVDEALGRMEQRPDAVFVDVDLPGASGAQFVLKLRQHLAAAGTPVMFVTAYQDRIYPILAAGLAERHVVDKPFRRGDILAALGRMLTANMGRRNRRIRLQPAALRGTVDDRSVTVKDLSVGGTRVVGNVSAQVGDDVVLTLRYGKHTVSMSALVGHVHDDGLGCRFSELDGETRAKLGRLIEEVIADRKFIPERVRARRTRLEVPALIDYSSDMSNVLLRNISATGAFVECKVIPRSDATVSIFIPYEHGVEVLEESPRVTSSQARVVRQEESGFGCAFVDPSPEFRKAVFDLMASE